jgi:hypothetical protein
MLRLPSTTVADFAESRRHPDRIVYRQTNDIAEQQIVVGLRHQLPLGTDAIEGLHQQRA